MLSRSRHRGTPGNSAWRPLLERATGRYALEVEPVTTRSWLYGGFTDVTRAMAHLELKRFDPAGEDSTKAVDETLKKYVRRSGWQGDYDLISSVSERRDRVAGFALQSR